jgi:hypothetical protein
MHVTAPFQLFCSAEPTTKFGRPDRQHLTTFICPLSTHCGRSGRLALPEPDDLGAALLGHTKLESTVLFLGVELDDYLEMPGALESEWPQWVESGHCA